MNKITKEMVSKVIDHTYLKSYEQGHLLHTQKENIKKLVKEAIEFKAYSVCVRPDMVLEAKKLIHMSKSNLKITTVVGFPNNSGKDRKSLIKEAQLAINNGVSDIDMVLSTDYIKKNKINSLRSDVYALSEVVKSKTLKVILETNALTKSEIKMISIAVKEVIGSSIEGPRFLKTSTGFYANSLGEKGATIEDVEIMKNVIGDLSSLGVKPSGGISDLETAIKFIKICDPYIDELTGIDPNQFRIGSSSLLLNLNKNGTNDNSY